MMEDVLPPNKPSPIRLLVALIVPHIASANMRVSFGVLAPFLVVAFGINKAQVGMLTSAVFLGMTLSWLPAGLLVDTQSVRTVLLWAQLTLATWIVGLSLAQSWSVALVIAFCMGSGLALIVPATNTAIISHFSPRRRGRAMGLKVIGNPVGVMLAAAILPHVAHEFGWRIALGTSAGVAILSALIFSWNYRDSPVSGTPNASSAGIHASSVCVAGSGYQEGAGPISTGFALLFSLLRDSYYYLVGFVTGALVLTQWCVNTYLVIFLQDVLDSPLVWASVMLILAQAVGAVGRLFWTTISDLCFEQRRKPVLVLLSFTGIAASIIAAFLDRAASQASRAMPEARILPMAVTVVLLGLSTLGWPALTSLFSVEKAGPARAGTSSGVTMLFSSWGGVVGPPLFGYVVDATSSYQLAWLGVAGVFVAVTVASLLLRERESSGLPLECSGIIGANTTREGANES